MEPKTWLYIKNYVCTTCLSRNRRLYPAYEVKEIIHLFPDIRFGQHDRICWECKALARKLMAFKNRTYKAQAMFLEVLNSGELNILQSLSDLSTVKPIYISCGDVVFEVPRLNVQANPLETSGEASTPLKYEPEEAQIDTNEDNRLIEDEEYDVFVKEEMNPLSSDHAIIGDIECGAEENYLTVDTKLNAKMADLQRNEVKEAVAGGRPRRSRKCRLWMSARRKKRGSRKIKKNTTKNATDVQPLSETTQLVKTEEHDLGSRDQSATDVQPLSKTTQLVKTEEHDLGSDDQSSVTTWQVGRALTSTADDRASDETSDANNPYDNKSWNVDDIRNRLKKQRQQKYREQNREKLKQREAERRKRKQNLQNTIGEPSTSSNVNRKLNNDDITDICF